MSSAITVDSVLSESQTNKLLKPEDHKQQNEQRISVNFPNLGPNMVWQRRKKRELELRAKVT